MPFIHQNADWPELSWDSDELSPGLAALRYREGQLVGRMQGLGFDLWQEASGSRRALALPSKQPSLSV